MKKYTKKQVFDYICGNDLSEKELNELENNVEFMTEIVCRDKNSYNICLDNIKSDFSFVKKLLDKYKDDKKFCIKVSDYFLEKNKDKYDELEICLLMKDILKDENEFVKLKYYIPLNFFFYEVSTSGYFVTPEELNNGEVIEDDYEEIDEEEVLFFDSEEEMLLFLQEEIESLGFVNFEELTDNKIILDYVAKTMLDYIFFKSMDFEFSIHQNYSKYDKIDSFGKYKVLYNYIVRKDEDLASYIAFNINTLDNILKELERIKNNWSNYERHLDNKKVNMYYNIISEIYSYAVNENVRCDIDIIIKYVSKKFGIYDEIKEYIKNDDIIINYERKNKISKYNMSIEDYAHLKDIEQIVDEIIKENNNDKIMYIKKLEYKNLKDNK